jgi:hypothetical protein
MTKPIEPEVMDRATFLMWVDTLNAVDKDGHADWRARRIAAEEICDMTGITDVVKAVSYDGILRPPPMWPETDCVPAGGGPGLITCEVRTTHHKMGRLGVKIGLRREGKNFDNQQIIEAVERGRFELARIINNA